MKQTLITLITIILLANCNSKQTNTTSVDSLTTHKDFISLTNPLDTLGKLISSIEFKLKATKEEIADGTDNFILWIDIENPNKDLYRLVEPNEIVLPYSSCILIIDYPLTRSAKFELKTQSNGFSRKQLIQEISDKYHLVYRQEDSTTLVKVIPSEKRENLINRNQTSGKYGIWGHDLADLDLSTIQVYKNEKGKIYLILEVES